MAGKVFVFGAGASREDTKDDKLPLPLANDFFQSDYINRHWPLTDALFVNFQDSSLAEILSHYFGVIIHNQDGAIITESSPNVEEVYSFLDSYENIYRSKSFQRDLFSRAKRELLDYILDVILYTPETEDHDLRTLLAAGDLKKEKKLRKFRDDNRKR